RPARSGQRPPRRRRAPGPAAPERTPAGAPRPAPRRLLEAPPSGRREGSLARRPARGAGRGPVRFWDSSAIVPLVLAQPRSAEARAWLAEDAEVVVWWSTRIECASAVARLHRDGHLPASGERAARELLDV